MQIVSKTLIMRSVSNKSNKPRVKIVNFNSKTNKFEFHIPRGHEKDPF